MVPRSTGGIPSIRVRFTLSFLLAATLCVTGVPSFAETPAAPTGGTQGKVAPPPTPAAATAPARDRRPQPLDEVSTIFEQKGVLTPKYSVTFEPSFQYTNISSSQVALLGYTIVPSVTIGVITVQDVNDDMFIAAMAFRFGLTNRSELEFKVPYVYRNNASASSPLNVPVNPSVFNADGYGFGDLEATLRYQLNQPVGPGGIYIASLRAKARNGTDPFEVRYNPVAEGVAGAGLPSELPVGSGFYAVQPAITMIYPADPAVVFGTLNYQWNIRRDISGVGTVDPADAYEINFGLGIGLNENFSFSLGYDHVVVGTSTRDGNRLGNSKTTQVASLLLGTTYRINKRTNLNISLGIGATSPAPDVQFTMKFPINFF